MPTRVSDLDAYDEPMPPSWEQALKNIHAAGGNGNFVEAEKLRIQMALLSTQANIDLYVNDDANRRANTELAAAEKRAAASDTIAKSLRRATWVLAAATVALVLATVFLAVRGG